MTPSRERLVALAAATGFPADTLEKVIRLGEFAADVARHPLLSRALALKGGTAVNLCFGAPRRLSVDLDFNYVASAERGRMLEDRPAIERAVETIASAQGYRVQRSHGEHAGRKMFLGYLGAHGSADRIEIDLNFLFRIPLAPVVRATLWQPGDLERPAVAVVAPAELTAGKLCALLDRSAPRDLFDTGVLRRLLGPAWRTRRFRRLFVAIAGTLAHPLHRYGQERLTRVTERMVVQQLHPMLVQRDLPSAGQLQRDAWRALGPLLDLDAAEREFTDRLQTGELAPELLFPADKKTAALLREHPALLWKAQNARAAKRER
jgi:predicted nucleotidyltransferase component of viral defense system